MNMRLKAVLVAGFLLVAGTVQAEVLFYDGFEYPVGQLEVNAQWNNVLFANGISPLVTDREILPGRGNCATGAQTGNGYSLRLHPFASPVDVTTQTVYISCLARQTVEGDHIENCVVLGLANVNTTGQKIEVRFYSHTNQITVTGHGTYVHFPTTYELGRVYRFVVKISPIAGETNKVMLDCGIADVTESPLPNEADMVYSVSQFEWNPAGGVMGSPFINVNFGMRGNVHLTDDLTVADSWADLQAEIIPSIGPGIPDGATDVLRNGTSLSWTKSLFAAEYDVYLGKNVDDVNSAAPDSELFLGTVTDTSKALGRLDFSDTYYWRVVEVNDAHEMSPRNNIWSFEVEPKAIAVTGVTVTASDTTEDPNQVIDGSGLTDGLHDNDGDNMWKTSLTPEHPIWIQFAFDGVCKLDGMKVWNHNSESEGLLGFGFKDVTIETSLDGTTWDVLADTQFVQAPGKAGYAGSMVDLGGTAAMYVKLTGKNNWSILGMQALGLSEVQFMQIPTRARELSPASGSMISPLQGLLSWRAGRDAAKHEVLLGSTPDDLTVVATVTGPMADISDQLSLGSVYYWQINEVNDAKPMPVWSSEVMNFSTIEMLVIDRMETYKDEEGFWIWQTWADGYEDPSLNGATVGHGDLPETEIYRSAGQSMPLFFDNSTAPTSIAKRTLDQADDITDWTKSQILVLYVHGDPANTGGELYVAVNGKEVALGSDAVGNDGWTQVNVDLTALNTDLSQVATLGIGIDGANAKGVIYVDDVLLYQDAPPLRPEPLPNIIANGSFEEYDPTDAPIVNTSNRRAINSAGSFTMAGWTCTHGNSYVGFDSHSARPAYDGDRYAFVNNDGIMTIRSDDVTQALNEGDTLRLSLEAASNGEGLGCSFRASLIFDAGLAGEKVVAFDEIRINGLGNMYYTNAYVTYTLDAAASTVAVSITMDNSGQGDQPRMDDVRLSIVP